jgi:hypothetical protein
MIRDVTGVIEREYARGSMVLTRTEPTKPMITDAAQVGLQEEPGFAPVPRQQIATFEPAMQLRERAVHLPAARTASGAPPVTKTPGVRPPWTCRARSPGAGSRRSGFAPTPQPLPNP